ncbi:hypothetical protein [Lacrimispora xylanisolvens]|uniref:hypothetical protein n=1 Tax=Lacrimispora xylanisolvens TaxID=384636 RepID=UPI002402D3BA
MGYKKYYTNKIIWYLITLAIAVVLNFILPRLMPGDPVSAIAARAVDGMTDSTAIQAVYEDYAEIRCQSAYEHAVSYFHKECFERRFWSFLQPVSQNRWEYYCFIRMVDRLSSASCNFAWLDSW